MLIKSVVLLNDQKLNNDTSSNVNVDSGNTIDASKNENCSSLMRICTYLNETYKFELDTSRSLEQRIDGDDDEEEKAFIFKRLLDCVRYLLKKNEKIFIIKKGKSPSS